MSKTVLLLGGNYSDIPIILKLKSLGYKVLSLGNRPQDLGHSFADEYIYADYSKEKLVLEIIEEKKPDYIVPGTNDRAYLTATYVAERLKYPGFDNYKIAKTIHDKSFLRQLLKSLNIPTPKFIRIEKHQTIPWDTLRNFKFPLIIKPVDSSGGRGITKIETFNKELIDLAVKRAIESSFSKSVVIEEFLEGKNFGFSAFIKDRKVFFVYTDEEFYLLNPYMVAATLTPSSLGKEVINTVKGFIEKIANHLGLKDGILHVQLVLSKGTPYILELCRRLPGDLYPYIVEMSTSFDYTLAYIKPFLGESLEVKAPKRERKKILRVVLMSPIEKRFVFNGLKFIKDGNFKLLSYYPLKKIGDKIENPLRDKIGIAFFEVKNNFKEIKPFELIEILTNFV